MWNEEQFQPDVIRVQDDFRDGILKCLKRNEVDIIDKLTNRYKELFGKQRPKGQTITLSILTVTIMAGLNFCRCLLRRVLGFAKNLS